MAGGGGAGALGRVGGGDPGGGGGGAEGDERPKAFRAACSAKEACPLAGVLGGGGASATGCRGGVLL